MKKDKKLSLLLLLFFLSGTSGLAFEVLWVRLAGLGFGHTVAAVATVLAAFMAGLGLGAWAFGRLIDRMSRGSDGLALYALLEVGIGVSALTLTAVLSHLDSYQIFLYGILSDIPQAIPLVKAISVFGLLLVPTALMGGTLPVVTSYTEQKYGRFGRRLASLYAMNTLGAAAACLAADFCLVPVLGVIQTAALAACVNLLVGAAAWRLRKAGITQGAAASREEELMGRGNRTSSRKRHAERSSFSVNGAAFCLVAAMVCGFAGLGAEVVWTRLLLFYTGSRVQAFSLMLAVFLLFTALGSMLAARVRAKQTAESSLEKLLARVFQLWGFGMIFSVFPMVAADRLLIHLSHGLVPDYARPLAGTLLSAATMALPCMALGASFPLLGRLYLGRAGSGSGRAVGHTYLANTVGSIAGSLAAGFFLLPALGSQRTLILLGGLGVIAGCLFNLSAVTSFRKWLVRAVPAALVLFAALLVPGDWVTRHVVLLSKPDSNVLLVREGIEETVVVTEEKTFGRIISRTLWTNGFSMSATTVEGQRYMRLMGHLPALMAAEAKKALLICYGVGNTLRALTAHRSFERIDVVELSGQVINADRFFHPFNRRALEDPRVSLHLSDGRNWLLRLGETYDVITCEPPPPTHAGVVSLYSRQYYELCRRRLSSGGIVCQWLPVNQMPYHEGLTLVRAFLDVFPHASLWFGSGCDLILLGSCGRPLEIDISRLASRAAESSVAGDLEAVGV
ncbi:MAG: fused MFS/spermidine synthase, partial [Gemmatimonadota bacterium]|nr:fused MFS/spermidine synthase [Gemmatimonadota bacterium]